MPRPTNLAQVYDEAVALFRRGHLDQADKLTTRALKEWPGSFDALHLLGVIKLQSGKPGAALGLFERALRVDPASPDAMSNLAMTLAALNRRDEALGLFMRAHTINPSDWQILNNRGSLLLGLNRAADALVDFDRALAIVPHHHGLRLNRGNALAQLRRFDDAIAEYDAVLAQDPAQAEAYFNRGNALASLGRTLDAIMAFDRALALRPDYLKALISRGVALQALNRNREALADFERALAIDKNHADAHHNAGLALLALGDYRAGFAKYEWRWQRTGMPPRRNLGRPLWLGEYPPARKTILVHGEQGLGDCIQFVRYAPLLARAGATVLLEAQRELMSLLARVQGVAQVVARGDALPPFDLHCPLASLPRALGTEVSTIPANVPYLEPDDDRVAKWRGRLGNSPSRRIAIAWSGSPHHPNDQNRSIALAQLAPLWSGVDANFVSIQRDRREEDAALLASMPRLVDVGPELDDFDDTAAVLSLVDLVIAVDTSVVHVAGALGRPTWVLLPFSPDWRWLLDRADSPWYPTARLFRQSAPGDWVGAIARVRAELVGDVGRA